MSPADHRGTAALLLVDGAAAPERTAAPARTAGIAGIGMAVPPEIVTNAPISARLGVEDGWIESRTGIRERRRATPDIGVTELATEAGTQALERAEVDAAALDLVLVATHTQDALLPTASPVVAAALGATRAGTIDIGAACTGFVSALALAAGQIESGRAENVLVVGAEIMSRVTDPDDRSTAGLFGDGAGAAVVTAGGPAQLGPAVQFADGVAGPELIFATHEDRLIRMGGQDTFKHAVNRLSEVTEQAVDAAGLELEDIDVFVYHQANGRILRAVGQRLRLASERVVDCIGNYGNTSAATVPIGLVEAEREGMLFPGARVVIAAFGAGFTWGAMTIEWGGEDA